MKQLTWLHLSDFHFRTEKSPKGKVEDFNRKIVLDSLLDDLRHYPKQKRLALDFILVTGDIAFSGRDDEYRLAATFLDQLLEIFELKKDCLFVIPGNHDIDRTKINSFMTLPLENRDKVNGFLMDQTAKGIHFAKFAEYKAFLNTYLDQHLAFDVEENYYWTKSLTVGESTIGLLGLNTAWNCCGDQDRNNLLIGEKQMRCALAQVKDADITVALLHHPLEWLRDDDREIIEPLLKGKCEFILQGHMHRQGFVFESNPDFRVVTIPAGSAYNSRPYSNSYNYLTFNLESRAGSVHLRRYADRINRWLYDQETFTNAREGIVEFTLNPRGHKETAKAPLALTIPPNYKHWIVDQCQYMDLKKLMERGKVIRVELPEVFIPLFTDPLEIKGNLLKEKHDPVEVEALAAESETLLIEGQAGSGKTTLLKHMAYAIIHRKTGNHLDNFLPVLVFLKDFQGYWNPEDLTVTTAGTAEKVLTTYLEEKNLDFNVVENFMKERQVIFLFDGLDEVKPDLRESIVNALAEFRIKHNRCTMIFSGRPHGIDSGVIKRFGNRHVKLHSLNMSQVELFVRKWFENIYHHGSEVAQKTGEEMIGEIRAHTTVSQLLDTPLMLTAICILYHDGCKLPEQRAELYKKFVDNLIFRRFADPEKVSDFLRHLAYATHVKKRRGFDKAFALIEMKKVYPRGKDETENSYRHRLEDKFRKIEEDCGLLKLEQGQFIFWHLSFQEFLTAVYLADYEQFNPTYWDDPWFKEVILLYIGYLSIASKASANKRVLNQLEDQSASTSRLLIAGWALLDIHKDRRHDVVLVKAKNRLMEMWETQITPKDRAESGEIIGWLGDPRDLEAFVPIEEGKYTLKNLGEVKLKGFELGQFPVTNAWFRKFVEDSGYDNPDFWTVEGRKWLKHTRAKYPALWYERKWKCPNSPVVGICWYEADAFCHWLTVNDEKGRLYRLPTEREWQAAASGKESRTYPWGDAWIDGTCNTKEAKLEKTSVVGIFLKTGTPGNQLQDLAGNVWEWTCSDYHSKKIFSDFTFDEGLQQLFDNQKFDEYIKYFNDGTRKSPVLRGGSWGNDHEDARCAYRDGDHPIVRDGIVGFRCARTLT